MTRSAPPDFSGPAGPDEVGPLPRRRSIGVRVGSSEAAIKVGGGAPVAVQCMTNTDTADIEGTVTQVAALARAGVRTCSDYRRSR